jgi:hypothetical protein
VEKTEAGYGKVQNDLVLLRRAELLPYHWLTDSTRWQRKPYTYSNIESALAEAVRSYRRDPWAGAEHHVEVWLEKDALAGVVAPITEVYAAPLMVARGYASLSFLHGAAETIREVRKPAFLYHLGDYDPSGVNAAEVIERTIRELVPEAEVHFCRLAITRAQIADLALPTRPTKMSDSRSRGFGAISVELDAMPPDTLRALVEDALRSHIPDEAFEGMQLTESRERLEAGIFLDTLWSLRSGPHE